MPAANANILVQHYKQIFGDTNQVGTIFEIGANNLEDTRILNYNFKNAKIYAFEPRLKTNNISINENVKVFNYAVSDIDEDKKSFYIVEGWEGASSLLMPKKEKGVPWTLEKKVRKIQVDVVTINKFAKQNNIQNIDLVWMDVQGNELRVLKGMTDYLSKVKMIQTEAGVKEYYENHTLFYEIKDFLSNYGFEIIYNTLEGGRDFNDGVTWEFETDVIFVNKRFL
jgi:FkbM family methyltransferase